MVIETIGLDPSLNHGSLVSALIQYDEEGSRLLICRRLVAWNNKDKNNPIKHLTGKSTPEEVASLGIEVTSRITPDHRALAIDYDRRSPYWRGRAGDAALLHYLTGYIVGYTAHFIYTGLISPAQVRAWLSLKSIASKEEVHEAFLFSQRLPQYPPDFTEDDIDALLLAVYISEKMFSNII